MNARRRHRTGVRLLDVLVVAAVLLTVVAVLAPLAFGRREKGWEAMAQADLRNAVLAAQLYALANDSYPRTSYHLQAHGLVQSPRVDIWFDGTSTDHLQVQVQHCQGGARFAFSSASQGLERLERADRSC